MGCAKSKNQSKDELNPGAKMEGGRRLESRRSNDSLIITVLWRRLSLFSRRGSSRKRSAGGGSASSARSEPGLKVPVGPVAQDSSESQLQDLDSLGDPR